MQTSLRCRLTRIYSIMNMQTQVATLFQLRSLDPVSIKKMKDLRKHYQYINSSLQNVNLFLDDEWEAYQASRKQNPKYCYSIVLYQWTAVSFYKSGLSFLFKVKEDFGKDEEED